MATQELPSRAKIVVIGGGVGGTSVAYHLAQLGEKDVILLDRSDLTSGSTFHSAGLVGQLRADPTLTKMNEEALTPYLEEEMSAEAAIAVGGAIIKDFMVRNTREDALVAFADLNGAGPFLTSEDIPFSVILPAFIISELKTAFQIGFLIFLPFLVIDMVISSILMSLGMMMLSPMLISLPFKLLLFVLVDGWSMTAASLVATFSVP